MHSSKQKFNTIYVRLSIFVHIHLHVDMCMVLSFLTYGQCFFRILFWLLTFFSYVCVSLCSFTYAWVFMSVYLGAFCLFFCFHVSVSCVYTHVPSSMYICLIVCVAECMWVFVCVLHMSLFLFLHSYVFSPSCI